MMRDAFADEALYEKYSDRLVRFAATIVGPADAEDVMTDGVVAAMSSRQWPKIENRPAYLYRCVLNTGRMHLRSTSRRRGREEHVTQLVPPAASGFDVPYLAPEVRDAVTQLSARQRAAIFLRYWEDLDERQIAERLGIGVGSVRRHLSRARSHIERSLNDAI